jgi:glycosyltransferase involved in cell wall biosynthesis
VLSLLGRVRRFYAKHGFYLMLRRAVQRAVRAGLDSHGARDEDSGFATAIVHSLDAVSASLGTVRVSPSCWISQSVSFPFEEISDVAIRLALDREFDQGVVILATSDGTELHHEAIEAGRVRDGVYRFGLSRAVRVAGDLRVIVGHRGHAGSLRLPLAGAVHAGLRALAVSGTGAVQAGVAADERTEGVLALRITGRGLPGNFDYWRGQRGAAPSSLAVIYVAGAPGIEGVEADAAALYALGSGGALALVLGSSIDIATARELVRAANLRFVPVLGLLDSPSARSLHSLPTAQLAHWSDLVLKERPADLRAAITAWLPEYRQKILPSMSLVIVLDEEKPPTATALESCVAQDYEGRTECVFVLRGQGQAAQTVATSLAARGARTDYRIVDCPCSTGDIEAAARGVAAASGRIVVFIDPTQIIGPSLLADHADAHSFGDCDAVIGTVRELSVRPAVALSALVAGAEGTLEHRLREAGCRVKVAAGTAATSAINRHGARPASTARRLRILTYRWHVAHQYELYKSGHDFTLLTDLPSAITQAWDFGQRPLPDNARTACWRDIREADYDLALLHFDENVLAPENTNGVLGSEWGGAFRWMMENLRLPKVAVCHGTPQFRGQYDPSYSGADLLRVIEDSRRAIVDYLGDTPVVCNSHQAWREWGFRNSRVIWHGFDPAEFPAARHERGILSPLGPGVMSRPHYRGYFLYREVFKDFPPEFAPESLFVPDPSPLYRGNQFAVWKYRNYVDQLRAYSVYFNPTQRSPMPRARAEPMMCGVVTVSANNHDVDMFIRNGLNGFYAESAEELREQLLFLMRNRQAAVKIGAEGRRTAADLFHIDRYLADWRTLLCDVA